MLYQPRYGPAYAFAQVAVSSALIVAFILFRGRRNQNPLGLRTPCPRCAKAAGFGAAFSGEPGSIVVVRRHARRGGWWTAPLFGLVTAAVFFAWIFLSGGLIAGTGAARGSTTPLVYAGRAGGAGGASSLLYPLLDAAPASSRRISGLRRILTFKVLVGSIPRSV